MSQNNKKKLILATGIFPPDIGGPSTYVFELAKGLIEKGWEIVVVSYGDDLFNFQFPCVKISRKQNFIFRYIKYFWAVFKNSKETEAVFAFDLLSSGVPAFFGALFRRKKTIVRMGGDALWEKAFACNWTNLPLEKYYTKKKSFKERTIFIFNKFLINRFSKVIFTNDWMKKIYNEYYKVKGEKSTVIKNPYPSIERSMGDHEKNKKFIFAGRLIRLKNLDRIIKVVSGIKEVELDIYGEGPEKENLKNLIKDLGAEAKITVNDKLSHDRFMEKLQNSYLALVPAITEVSPNTVLECIRLGVPVLTTKECGLYDDYKDDLIFINPLDSEDIRKKIRLVLKTDVYEAYKNGIQTIDTDRNFSVVANEVNDVINKL